MLYHMNDENYTKFSIDLSVVDHGKIEYLAERGFYLNRAEFVRTAIKNELLKHEDWLDREIKTRKMDVGIIDLRKEDLKALKERLGSPYHYFVIGRLRIDPAITADEMRWTAYKLKVYGKLECRPEIRDYYKNTAFLVFW